MIKLARHEAIARPGRNAQIHCKFLIILFRINLKLDAAGVGITGELTKCYLAGGKRDLRFARCVESAIDCVGTVGIDHSGHLGEQAGKIGGAAGGAEPGGAASAAVVEVLAAISLKHIYIEELVAFQIHTGQHVVVERYFRHVEVFRIARRKIHAIVEKHVAHGSACLVVSVLIRQVIVRSEALDSWYCSEATVDVHLAVYEVMPDALQGRIQRGVASSAHHISHTGVKVHGSYRMALSRALVSYRQMLLCVGGSHHTLALRTIGHASHVDKFLGHIEVKSIAGCLP